MALSARTVRSRIQLLQPLMKSASLETIRRGQNRLGELIENKYRRQILTREHIFTHVIWRMQVVRLTAERQEVPGYAWYTGAEPLPEAFLKCLR